MLERMRWWHVEQLLPIEQALFGGETWTARTFWSELAQLDTRHFLVALDGADRDGADLVGADLAGAEVVGYAGLCDYPDEAWVQTMAVATAAQGSGLGARLLTSLLEIAGALGHRTVSLEVREDNVAARALYARTGFVQTGLRRGYYQAGTVDALVLTRHE